MLHNVLQLISSLLELAAQPAVFFHIQLIIIEIFGLVSITAILATLIILEIRHLRKVLGDDHE